ncbi:MAG: tRNA adenosine(34) deaminase TadA [Proteobacteria bacterium]|nr:tRNA adenosine(34) deaminase TadA [Pseudomonadota bacterium]
MIDDRREVKDKQLRYMRRALTLASQAELRGEVPVGCIIVLKNKIIAEAFNQPIIKHDPSAHAEIVALRLAGKLIKNYRLPGTVMYVTLEPCAMCIGAIINARVSKVFYGASDPKFGACGSMLSIHENVELNHHTAFEGGLLANESAELLRKFFKCRRK